MKQRPVMYLIANEGLGMSPGKLAAQVAHGAVRSAHAHEPEVIEAWFSQGETKIVLSARDSEHLLLAQKYIEGHGIKTFLVIDEGRTEIAPLSPTVLAVQLVDKNNEHVQFVFETFKTYKDDARLEKAKWQGEVRARKAAREANIFTRILKSF